MMIEAIETKEAPRAIGPYSQAVAAGSYIFCSGQVAIDPSTQKLVDGGIEPETRQVLSNLKAVVQAAGGKWGHIAKTTVYLQDFAEFAKFNEIYRQFFKEPYPARVTVEVAKLPLGARVEIDAVVWLAKNNADL